MFRINKDGSIYLTRGDIAVLDVVATTDSGESYVFVTGDIVRLKVIEKKRHDNVVLEKDIEVDSDTTVVTISLDRADTKIGDLINKPVDYWYEIELNPETTPQTIIGYDDNGPKIFRLFPEGED